jgi:radical SAM protein with 4Fe4S-binding SPASM domain
MTNMRSEQDAPNAVQIELSEGCNLYCTFCGLQGIREKSDKNFKFMETHTLRSVMQQMTEAEWNPRVEFASHGEPTMHPQFIEMVRVAREIAPKYFLMMTSNGGGLLRKPGPLANVRALFDAGLNVLALDDYDGVGIISKVRAALAGQDFGDIKFYEYPAQADGNPHQRIQGQRLVFVQDISKASKGTHSTLNNHAGAGAPRVAPDHPSQTKRCAKPFREMTVRWDGNVALCCNNWEGSYKCGNVVRDGLDKVWNGNAMYAARQMLILGKRDFKPCQGCDALSYRVGLLPDKYGQKTMLRPNAKTRAHIAAALAGAPYTTPVRRPWENDKENRE